jgi:hypothetical protein
MPLGIIKEITVSTVDIGLHEFVSPTEFEISLKDVQIVINHETNPARQ